MNLKQPPKPPGAAERALQQAVLALQAGQPDQAEWLAAEAVKTNPSDARAQHLLGHARLLQGRAKDAIEPLEQAARRSHDPAAETQLAMALRQVGRSDEALDKLERAAKRKPPFPPAFLEMGNLLAALDRGEEAIAVLERALTIAPRMGELSIQLGFIHYRRGDNGKARELITRGLATAPNDVDGLYLLARLLQSQCEYAQAAQTYRRLLALAPHDAAARIGLGVCLLELGQADAAFDSLRSAARTNEKMFGDTLTALSASGHGRFWLKPSDAARRLKGN
jgi:tetratricopeptide (TPR) repeat protein